MVVRYSYDAWGMPTIQQDSSDCFLAITNPYLYRGYYFDFETLKYYLQSRYYDPVTGRFINADEATYLGASGTILGYNLFAYCGNNPVNMIDVTGFAAINIIFAAIGSVVGWLFGDYVAKKLGYHSGWKYWAIRTGVLAGGAILGWFAGSLLAKIIAAYLKSKPDVIFGMFYKLGAKGFQSTMNFLGINPFSLAKNSGKFIAIARLFNTKAITICYAWAVKLFDIVRNFGYRIVLDAPHSGYTWHIHLIGGNGKLENLHIQIEKIAWDYLSNLLQ